MVYTLRHSSLALLTAVRARPRSWVPCAGGNGRHGSERTQRQGVGRLCTCPSGAFSHPQVEAATGLLSELNQQEPGTETQPACGKRPAPVGCVLLLLCTPHRIPPARRPPSPQPQPGLADGPHTRRRPRGSGTSFLGNLQGLLVSHRPPSRPPGAEPQILLPPSDWRLPFLPPAPPSPGHPAPSGGWTGVCLPPLHLSQTPSIPCTAQSCLHHGPQATAPRRPPRNLTSPRQRLWVLWLGAWTLGAAQDMLTGRSSDVFPCGNPSVHSVTPTPQSPGAPDSPAHTERKRLVCR